MTQAASPLTEARTDLLRLTLRKSGAGILFAAFVGVFINALHLIVPLYMLQVYDRVISSRSIDTLVMLTLLAGGCLVFMAVIDFIRARVFIIVGEQMARRLNATVLEIGSDGVPADPVAALGQRGARLAGAAPVHHQRPDHACPSMRCLRRCSCSCCSCCIRRTGSSP